MQIFKLILLMHILLLRIISNIIVDSICNRCNTVKISLYLFTFYDNLYNNIIIIL